MILTATMPYNPLTAPEEDPPGYVGDRYPKKSYDIKVVEDFYFKIGFAETILTNQLKRNCKVTLKYADRNDVHYIYI